MRVPRAESWIGGTIGDGKFVIGLRLLDGLDRRPQVRPVVQRNLVIIAKRLKFRAELKEPRYIELIDRRAVVEQQQKLNLLLAQIDDCGFDFRLVLHALKFYPRQIDLGQVAGLEAGPAYVDDLVVVLQVGLGQRQHRLGLKSLHKGRAQAEEQIAFEVHVLGLRSRCLSWRSPNAIRACARVRADS